MKILLLNLLSLILLMSCAEQEKGLDPEELANELLIIDSHIDVPYRLWRQHLKGDEIENIAGSTKGDFDFLRSKKGGLNVPFFSIYLPASTQEDGTSHEMANQMIDMVEDIWIV